jgi:hypothetical protein
VSVSGYSEDTTDLLRQQYDSLTTSREISLFGLEASNQSGIKRDNSVRDRIDASPSASLPDLRSDDFLLLAKGAPDVLLTR